MLLSNGKVSNIRINGKAIFKESIKKAIKKSFPINVKNAPITLPKKISFKIRYQIR